MIAWSGEFKQSACSGLPLLSCALELDSVIYPFADRLHAALFHPHGLLDMMLGSDRLLIRTMSLRWLPTGLLRCANDDEKINHNKQHMRAQECMRAQMARMWRRRCRWWSGCSTSTMRRSAGACGRWRASCARAKSFLCPAAGGTSPSIWRYAGRLTFCASTLWRTFKGLLF